jgi:tetraprenyl-beta-curcumene synthase
MLADLREAWDLASAFAGYRATVIPPLRREIRRWGQRARLIPDPVLRRQAVEALEGKVANVEAIGVFATLAPRAQRRRAIAAMATLQIAVDYIDTLSEVAGEDALADALQLHRALAAALTPGAEPEDWYRHHHPHRDDGGYLSELVAACQNAIRGLPAEAAILPLAREAARRCGEGQSRTHAAAHGHDGGVPAGGVGALQHWANELESPPGYRWWEVAAGASSSVAAHALIAAAATPGTSAQQARLIDDAYFPPVGALTVLLDDLVDLEQDNKAGEHNYIGYYRDSGEAGDRLALIASRAAAAITELPRRRRHEAVLSGVGGFYLSAPGSRTRFAGPVRDRLLDSLSTSARLLATALRLQRR